MFACLATCSVADCERKHSGHKRLCRSNSTTFVSMLVNSVNDEIRNTWLRVQQDAKKKGTLVALGKGGENNVSERTTSS
jgi:hypothetical protein